MEQFLTYQIPSFIAAPWMFPSYLAIPMSVNPSMEVFQPYLDENFMRFSTLPMKRMPTNLEEDDMQKPMPRDISQGARGVKWVDSEDMLLFEHVKQHGPKCWATASSMINKCVHLGKEVRNGKHCRERWYNHLNPELKSNI